MWFSTNNIKLALFQILNIPLLIAARWHANYLHFFWPGAVRVNAWTDKVDSLRASLDHIEVEYCKCSKVPKSS